MLDWLAYRAQVSPAKTALIFGERQWTYGQLNAKTAQLAAQLAAAGVVPEQHVAVLLPNGPEFVIAIHALARLGAVMTPLNLRLTPAELRWQAKQAGCAVVLGVDATATTAALGVRPVNLQSLPAAADAEQWCSRPLNLEARQGIVFTSGTTGQPKGAMLTFNNHLWSATASAFRLGTDPRDRWLACMPLYHVGGQAIVLRCCLYGTTIVLHPTFDPAAVAESLRRDGVTLISVVPTMLHRLLEYDPDSLCLPHLRCILVGGAALSPQLARQGAEFHLPIATTYGLTEAASQVATAAPAEARRKPGSVGKPLLFSAVRIVDRAGNPVPTGDIGEIVISGPTVMTGYYQQPDATAKTLRHGELFSGDMGYLDGDGDLWVVQRRADLIVSGGENIYPAEVEAVLSQHPAVAEVCVIGLPDREWGQRVAAAVVLHAGQTLTTQSLLDFCRPRLAGYKIPRDVQWVDSLPQTASGKIKRDEVKQLFVV